MIRGKQPSIQRKRNEVQRDINNLELQLRREVKKLRRKVRNDVKAAEDCNIAEEFEADVHNLWDKSQLSQKALQEQVDTFKADLKHAGLMDPFA